MEITGKEILELIGKIIKENDKFSIKGDHYWEISAEEIYNVYKKPEDLVIGQLTEDWSELRELLSNEREPILFHDLAHFSQILRAIAEEKQD